MDHELKQRLIGAVVVTALAAIFVPMLFDDPVNNSSELIAQQTIPTPASTTDNLAAKVPANSEQVLNTPDQVQVATDESAVLSDEIDDSHVKPDSTQDGLYAETPGFDDNTEPTNEKPVVTPKKPSPTNKPATAIINNTASAIASTQDQATKKAIKPKTPVNVPEQELLKKLESANLSQDSVPAKALPPKKLDPPAVVPTKAVNPAKAVAEALADGKKPEVPAKPAAPVRWYIQVGSFSKKENATSLLEGLKAQGLPASLDAVQTSKGTTYRLRVGPELDGKKAAAMKSKLDKQNISAILVSEQQP